jgi:hypothetical protein
MLFMILGNLLPGLMETTLLDLAVDCTLPLDS